MQMTHREAVDLAAILMEFGAPPVWQGVCAGRHEDIVQPRLKRLTDCVAAHWRENGCSFDAGRDGMIFPDTCDAAQKADYPLEYSH